MISKLTYKQRFIGLCGIAVLAIILVYVIAISETIRIKQEMKDIEEKLADLESLPQKISETEYELSLLNNQVGEDFQNNQEFQKTLFDLISKHCTENSLVLRNFPRIETWQNMGYTYLTGYAQVEGSFKSLLKTLYSLETGSSPGKIISVDFLSAEDRRMRRFRLTMSIYIQTIKQNDYANYE